MKKGNKGSKNLHSLCGEKDRPDTVNKTVKMDSKPINLVFLRNRETNLEYKLNLTFPLASNMTMFQISIQFT